MSSTDGAGMSDGVHSHLSGPDHTPDLDDENFQAYLREISLRDQTPQADPLPDRPAEGAGTIKWLEYVVSLGASREAMTGGLRHWDDETQKYKSSPTLTRSQLIELANRLSPG